MERADPFSSFLLSFFFFFRFFWSQENPHLNTVAVTTPIRTNLHSFQFAWQWEDVEL